METDLLKRIEINPEIMLGKPVIKGTRIAVEHILRKLAADISVAQILNDFPNLEQADVQAAILFAAEELGNEELVPLK